MAGVCACEWPACVCVPDKPGVPDGRSRHHAGALITGRGVGWSARRLTLVVQSARLSVTIGAVSGVITLLLAAGVLLSRLLDFVCGCAGRNGHSTMDEDDDDNDGLAARGPLAKRGVYEPLNDTPAK